MHVWLDIAGNTRPSGSDSSSFLARAVLLCRYWHHQLRSYRTFAPRCIFDESNYVCSKHNSIISADHVASLFQLDTGMIFSRSVYDSVGPFTTFCIFFQHKSYCTDTVWEPAEGISLWKQIDCRFPGPEDTPEVAPRKEWADGVRVSSLSYYYISVIFQWHLRSSQPDPTHWTIKICTYVITWCWLQKQVLEGVKEYKEYFVSVSDPRCFDAHFESCVAKLQQCVEELEDVLSDFPERGQMPTTFWPRTRYAKLWCLALRWFVFLKMGDVLLQITVSRVVQ
jgi:hypothetical protein